MYLFILIGKSVTQYEFQALMFLLERPHQFLAVSVRAGTHQMKNWIVKSGSLIQISELQDIFYVDIQVKSATTATFI